MDKLQQAARWIGAAYVSEGRKAPKVVPIIEIDGVIVMRTNNFCEYARVSRRIDQLRKLHGWKYNHELGIDFPNGGGVDISKMVCPDSALKERAKQADWVSRLKP
jgi:hypothetical protein